MYIIKQLFLSISVIGALGIFSHYSPRFQRIIVNYCNLIINRIRKQTTISKDIYVYISCGQFMCVAVSSPCAEVKQSKS